MIALLGPLYGLLRPFLPYAFAGLAIVGALLWARGAVLDAERARVALASCRLEIASLRMRLDAEAAAAADPDPLGRLRREFGHP